MSDIEKIAAGRLFDKVSDEELAEEFWAKVDRRSDDECWPWKGVAIKGRGALFFKGVRSLAPRLALYFHTGKMPPSNIFACHACDNPICCNPAHLWWGTALDNVRDMHRKRRAFFQKQTHCRNGHPRTQENLYSWKGRISCKECLADMRRKLRKRRLEKLSASSTEPSAVATHLTAQQRRSILAGLKYGQGYWFLRRALMNKGITDESDNLTAFGVQVRNHLRAQENGNG